MILPECSFQLLTRGAPRRRLQGCMAQVLSALVLSFGSAGAVPAFGSEAAQAIAIEAGPLDAAILELASEADISIFLPPSLAKGKTVPSIAGTMTAEEALRRILEGTGLTFQREGGRAYVVVQIESGLKAAEKIAVRRDIFEEVVVTATKREESLQEVPMSISAFTSADLERQGIENYADFARQVPGVNLNYLSKNLATSFTIRGIATSTTGNGFQKSVAIYIDEMPVTNLGIVEPDLRLYDIERVEVLRGPQGTLFGSGSLAGAVRILTKKADLSRFDTSTSVDFGLTESDSFRQRYNTMINLPLMEDELALRLVSYYRDEEGYVDNIERAIDNVDSSLDWGLRASLRWRPVDRFSATFALLYEDSDPDASSLTKPALGEHKNDIFLGDSATSVLTNYNAVLEYDFGWASLTSSTIYSSTEERRLSDISGAVAYAFPYMFDLPSTGTALVEEVRLVSAGGAGLQWLVGGFFMDRNEDSEFKSFTDAAFLQAKNITGLPGTAVFNTFSSSEIRELAAFGEISYPLADTLTLVAGLRYASFETTATTSARGFDALEDFFPAAFGDGNANVSLLPVPASFATTGKLHKLTKKFSLTWLPADSQTYYLLASEGFRIGQPNVKLNGGVSLIDPSDVVIPDFAESDTLWNYEIGAKVSWLDGQLTTNLAVYYINWKDTQLQAFRVSDGALFVTNAGKAVSKGVELEMVASPTEALELGLNITYQNAEITRLTAEEAAISGGEVGHPLSSPDFQIAAFIQYSWMLNHAQELYARLDAQHVGSYPNGLPNIAGRPGVPHPAFTELDAYENVNISLGWIADQWTFTLYGENVLDNDDYTFASLSTLNNNRFATLRPRTFGIRTSWTY